MRKAINENPRVQMAVIGIGGVLAAILIFGGVLGGGGKKPGSEPPPPVAGGTTATGTPTTPTTPTTPDTTTVPDTSTTPTSPDPDLGTSTPVEPAPSGAPSGADGLLPGKGLPPNVLIAYARNKAIALLVIDPHGSSDRQVREFTDRLSSRNDVAVFVVNVKKISDYSRITEGVSVSRVPALIVIRPRNLTADLPTASVSYGFRGAKSVRQALEDALYEGGTRTSDPG